MTHKDIIEVASWLGMKPAGGKTSAGWIPFRCPFAEWYHDSGRDSNPSFSIKINPTGISGYNCLACKRHGRISSLIRRLRDLREDPDLQGLDIEADLRETSEDLGNYELEIEEESEPAVLNPAIYVNMYPLAWEEKRSREYLQRRGIGKDTARLMGLLFDPDQHRIVFPVMDRQGQLFGFEGRTILPETPRNPKMRVYAAMSKEKVLLAEHLVDDSKPLFVVEGLFATARIIEIGGRDLVNPVAPLTSRISKFQRDRIAAINRMTYLCFDDDRAGNEGLFGPWDETTQNWAGGGALDLLSGHVPVALPNLPHDLDDIDKVTLAQLRRMVEEDFEMHR
jgi:hypothetical protein